MECRFNGFGRDQGHLLRVLALGDGRGQPGNRVIIQRMTFHNASFFGVIEQHRMKFQVPDDNQKNTVVKKRIRNKLGQTGKPKFHGEGTIQ